MALSGWEPSCMAVAFFRRVLPSRPTVSFALNMKFGSLHWCGCSGDPHLHLWTRRHEARGGGRRFPPQETGAISGGCESALRGDAVVQTSLTCWADPRGEGAVALPGRISSWGTYLTPPGHTECACLRPIPNHSAAPPPPSSMHS